MGPRGYRDSERRGPRHEGPERRGERREVERGSRIREAEIGEAWPELPDWADPAELDADVRRDLRGLSKEGAEFVAGHLLAAGTLAEDEPDLAWRHARAARSKGGRIAVVRETVGLVAYRAGEWAEALSELRAARRMGGGAGQLAVMADCERALGHPEKAIELSRSVEAADLDEAGAAELRIVVAGARADLGQLEAAIGYLEAAGVKTESGRPFSARLWYAYGDLLAKAGRAAEALDAFMKAADMDEDEETDALDRIDEFLDPDVAFLDPDVAVDADSAREASSTDAGLEPETTSTGDADSDSTDLEADAGGPPVADAPEASATGASPQPLFSDVPRDQ